jgi:YesN/AraC family two-component response regulator
VVQSSILLNTPRIITASEISGNNPNWYIHNVDYTQIIYIEAGSGEFIFEEKQLLIQEGSLIILNPLSKIEGKSSYETPLKGISVSFSNLHINGKMQGFMTDSNEKPVVYLNDEKCKIHNYLCEIVTENQSKKAGYQDIIISLLKSVIIKVFRLLEKKESNLITTVSQIVKRYIEENFRQELSLNDLANHVYVSPYHLAHVFKEEVGLPPIQYMIQCRIEEAKRLLTHSNLSVREIASIVGYENANYFNLLFKKIEGEPPGKYRKRAM